MEIIGEACRGLSEDFRRRHSDEIWSDAIGLRNVLAHQYFGIDHEAVWMVVARDLPALSRRSNIFLKVGRGTVRKRA